MTSLSGPSSAKQGGVLDFFSAVRKNKDLMQRIWFTLAALIVYRIGTYVPLPGIDPAIISNFAKSHGGGFLGMLDMFSGGAVGRMTVFALNIMPYISASIIVQLMTSVSPHLEALKKEGESGKRKLNQYTRYGTVFLACIQSFGIAVGLEKIVGSTGAAVLDPGFFFRLTTIITLTGGTLFIVWLGEQITSRGIGNGTSLIIYSGIVANLPQAVINTLKLKMSPILVITILVSVALLMAYIVFMESAQRKVTIHYPKQRTAMNGPVAAPKNFLPLKLNVAGVIPPIFASSLLMLPATVLSFSSPDPDSWMGWFARMFAHGHPLYIGLFVFLIVFFAFFYTALVFNPEETAENLNKSQAFIPGIRPGKSTAEYLEVLLSRLTAIGSLYLVSICIIPELILSRIQLPFYLSGTSLLIVVNVTIETIKQINSYMFEYQHKKLLTRNKFRLR